MTPTPFLKPFNLDGGTLYVFPSVSRDLTRTVVSGDYEFSFSHFACLNLPDIYSGDYDKDSDMTRAMYISTMLSPDRKLERRPEGWTTLGMGYALTENLQNYVMNFETAILNGEGDNDDYDPDILTTVSEKIFWNWLEKIGAIKFNETGTEEDYGGYADRVVQYIGDIDIMNTVTVNGDSFEELYIHVPSTAGASTSVYFRPGIATDNKNYLSKNYSVANGNLSSENIIGRDSDRVNIYDSNISIKAIYDIDTGGNIYIGDAGHTIDFRDSSYDGGDGINNMNNKSLEDFEFNAVLIYYDLYEKTSTPGVRRKATNLYGILFLDNVIDDVASANTTGNNSRQGHFQRYPKKKETVYGNGNSYALKIDLKIDTIGDASVDYRVIEDPNNPAAMALYAKSLTQLQNSIDVFFTLKNELVKLTERVATLENMILGIDSITHMKQDIDRLYNLCDGNNLVDTGALLGLIDENTRKLENIMNGGKDIKLQFDTDVIQPGNGIGIKKSLNKVVISSEQKYSVNSVYDGLMDNETEISQNNPIDTLAASKVCTIPLKPGENFAVIYINDNGDSPSNLNINISQGDYQWEVGQSMKLYFVCNDGGSLQFVDSDTLGIVIKVMDGISLYVPAWEFEGNNLIEVVCVALSDTSDNGNVNENKFIYLIK